MREIAYDLENLLNVCYLNGKDKLDHTHTYFTFKPH